MIGHGLGVISSTRGNDAALFFILSKGEDLVQRSALFERTSSLLVIQLKKN